MDKPPFLSRQPGWLRLVLTLGGIGLITYSMWVGPLYYFIPGGVLVVLSFYGLSNLD